MLDTVDYAGIMWEFNAILMIEYGKEEYYHSQEENKGEAFQVFVPS